MIRLSFVGLAGLLGVLLSLVGSAQIAAPELQTGHWVASYSVSHLKQVVGEMRRETRLDAQGYSIRSELVPMGMGRLFGSDLIEQLSEGDLVERRWRPQHYFFYQSSKPDKPRDFTFDWPAQAVKFADKSLSFKGQLHDELSQMLELRRRLADGELAVDLQVLSGSKRRIYDYWYRVEAEELMTVLPLVKPVAEPALRVVLTTSRGKYEMRFWLGIERGYLPLRIERTEIRKQRTAVMKLIGFEQAAHAK